MPPTAPANPVMAYKQLPAEVLEPLRQAGGWVMWLFFAYCVFRLMIVAAQFAWAFKQRGEFEGPDNALMVVFASIVGGAASGIAAALLAPG